MKKFAFLIAGLLLAGSASAQMAKQQSGVYVGIDGGLANTAKDNSLSRSTSQNNNTGFLRGAVGYQFTPNWALEAGYFSTGDFKIEGRSMGQTHSSTTSVKGFDLSGIYKFDNGIFLKAGWHHSTRSASGSSRAGNTVVRRWTHSDSGSGYLLGLGYDFELSPNASVNVAYTRMQKVAASDGSLNMISVGMKYRF